MVHEIPAEWLPVRCETNRPSGPIGLDGLFVWKSSLEIPEGLMNKNLQNAQYTLYQDFIFEICILDFMLLKF